MIIIGILNNFLSLRGSDSLIKSDFKYTDDRQKTDTKIGSIDEFTEDFKEIFGNENKKKQKSEFLENPILFNPIISESSEKSDQNTKKNETPKKLSSQEDIEKLPSEKNIEQISKNMIKAEEDKIKEFVLKFTEDFMDEDMKMKNLKPNGDNEKINLNLFEINNKDQKIQLVPTKAPLFFNINSYKKFFKSLLKKNIDIIELSKIFNECKSNDSLYCSTLKTKQLLPKDISKETKELEISKKIAKKLDNIKNEKAKTLANFLSQSESPKKEKQQEKWQWLFKDNPLFAKKTIEKKLEELNIDFISYSISKFLTKNFTKEYLTENFPEKNLALLRIAEISLIELDNFQQTYENLKENTKYTEDLKSFFNIFKNGVMTNEFTKEEEKNIKQLINQMSDNYGNPKIFSENFKMIKEIFVSKFTNSELNVSLKKDLNIHHIFSTVKADEFLFLIENSDITEAMNIIKLITKTCALSPFMENSVYHIFNMIILDINSEKSKEFAKESLKNFLNFQAEINVQNIFANIYKSEENPNNNKKEIRSGLISLYSHLRERTEWHQKDSDLKISFDDQNTFDASGMEITKLKAGKNFQLLYNYFKDGKIDEAFSEILDKDADFLYEGVEFSNQSEDDIRSKKIESFNSIKKYFTIFGILNRSTFKLKEDKEIHENACKVVRNFLQRMEFLSSESVNESEQTRLIFKALKSFIEKKENLDKKVKNEKKIKKLQKNEEENKFKLQQKMKELEEKNKLEMQELEEKNKLEIKKLQDNNNKETVKKMKELKEKHQREIEELQKNEQKIEELQKNEQKIEELKKQHKEAIEKLQENNSNDNKEQLNKLLKEHTQETKKLEEENTKKAKELEEKHTKETKKLEEENAKKIEELKEKNNKLQNKIESENKKNKNPIKDEIEQNLVNRILANGIPQNNGLIENQTKILNEYRNYLSQINQQLSNIKKNHEKQSDSIKINNDLLKRPIEIKHKRNFLQQVIHKATVPFLMLYLHYLNQEKKASKKISNLEEDDQETTENLSETTDLPETTENLSETTENPLETTKYSTENNPLTELIQTEETIS